MSRVQKSPYTGKYQVGNRVIVNEGGTYASNRGMVVEVKPDKPSHNCRVTFDVFSRGIWFSEGELLPDESEQQQPNPKRHYDFEFGIGQVGPVDDPFYDLMTALPTRPRNEEMITLDCGHTVPRSWSMNASAGTACPDCYDRMSG